MLNETINARVTHLKIEKGFIIICAQDKENPHLKQLTKLPSAFSSSSAYNEDSRNVNIRALHIACIDKIYYERCKIIFSDEISRMAQVKFLDLGYEAMLSFQELRPIKNYSSLSKFPSLFNEFVISGIKVVDYDRQYHTYLPKLFDEILKRRTATITILEKNIGGAYVNLTFDDNEDLVKDLIPRFITKKVHFPILLNDQMQTMTEYAQKKNSMQPIARNLKPPPPPKFSAEVLQDLPKTTPVFKTNVLAYQSIKNVRISHCENGPYMFYVQLDSLSNELERFTNKLQKSELRHFSKPPATIGMACLARYERRIYRAAIAKLPSSSQDYLVNFVDYGFSGTVRLENLFYISEEFLAPLTYAIEFCLANIRNIKFPASDHELNFFFRDITENQLMSLKCVPSDGPPICQYCELFFDVIATKNVTDVLKSFNPYELQYKPQKKLEICKEQLDVKVVYIESTKDFYVQLQTPDKLLDYDLNYDELQRSMNRSPILRNPKSGMACAVSISNEWFRGSIKKVIDANKIRVTILDFGLAEDVPANCVRITTNRFVEHPSFAYRASLAGFEDQEVSENITTQFEIFSNDSSNNRKIFKMMITGMIGDAYLAQLDDLSINPPVNVNKLLLKNSRPLSETIQLENAKKRQKDATKKDSFQKPDEAETFQTILNTKSYDRDRNSAQRGRAYQMNKGSGGNQRGAQYNNQSNITDRQQSPRSFFGKPNHESHQHSPSPGSNYKKDNTSFQQNPQKMTDCEDLKNITRIVTIADESIKITSMGQSQKAISSKAAIQQPQKTLPAVDNATKNTTSGHLQKAMSPKASSKQQPEKNLEADTKKVDVIDKQKNVNNIRSGWVSTLLTINRAFVHYDEHVEGLEKILDRMYAFYENQTRPALKEMKIGTLCAARSIDNNWYRSKIESIDGDKVKVFFCEYGNSEIVHSSKIRLLEEQFSKIDKLVVETFFAIKPASECDEKTVFNELTKRFENGGKEFGFEIMQPFASGWILEPIDNSKKLFDELCEKKIVQRINIDELTIRINENEHKQNIKKIKKSPEKIMKSPEKIKKSPEKEKVIVKQSTRESVIKLDVQPMQQEPPQLEQQTTVEEKPSDPSHIPAKLMSLTSPTDFYMCRLDTLANFERLHNDIQIVSSSMPALLKFEEGTLCLAQQPFDHNWYRSKIVDCDENDSFVTVRCLDDGKTFSVDKTSLRQMPPELENKQFFGISCSMPIRIERKREDEATKLLMSMIEDETEYTHVCSSRDKSKNYIELFYKDENIADKLVSLNYAHRLDIVPAGKAFTSHINSLSDFYLQLADDQLKLDLISRFFEVDHADGKFEDVVNPEAGKIVTALFPEDGCWYRAKIESIEENGFEVLFIDFGNTCRVQKIGAINEEAIAELPALSKRCCLAKPKGVNKFSELAEKQFSKICAKGETILEVRTVAPGVPAVVEVSYDGKDITEELLPLCKVVDLNVALETSIE